MALSNAERQRLYIQRLKARAGNGTAVSNGHAPEPTSCNLTPTERPELTSAEQDQILNLALRLIMTVDHPHRKKFLKHLVSNAVGGVFVPTCSHRGWKGGRYIVDTSLLDRLWKAFHADP